MGGPGLGGRSGRAASKAAADLMGFMNDRVGFARTLAPRLRRLHPSHWSFLLGEIALYSFLLLVITGTFLTFFYEPVRPYDSVLRITFDVKGGMLIRQLHHWSATVFVFAIVAHLIRVFFTGAFRKPRELTWMIGVLLLAFALAESFFGYSLTGDLLAGTGLRIMHSLRLSIPVAGSYVAELTFGSGFPGRNALPRLFVAHVLLVPGLLAALIPIHALILTWRQRHTQRRRGLEMRREASARNRIIGGPFFPLLAIKNTATVMFTFGAISLLATVSKVNPIWLRGPYSPARETVDAQPFWYFGVLDGALRLTPGWETVMMGHTFSVGLWIPPLILLSFFGVLLVYPFLERRFTGDREWHHLLDRPRDVPGRTALGVAVLVFFGVLWAATGIRYLGDPVLGTWLMRAALLALPVLAYAVTRTICRRARWGAARSRASRTV